MRKAKPENIHRNIKSLFGKLHLLDSRTWKSLHCYGAIFLKFINIYVIIFYSIHSTYTLNRYVNLVIYI